MILDQSSRHEVGPRKNEHQSTTMGMHASPFISTLTDGEKNKGAAASLKLPTPSLSTAPTQPKEQDAQHQDRTHLKAPDNSISESSPPLEAALPRIEYTLDVYAKSYVPSWLRAINDEPAEVVVDTRTKHRIAFETYIRHFAGLDLLQRQFHGDEQWPEDRVSQPMELSEQSYLPFFSLLLRQELGAKKIENEQYSLYKVPLQPIDRTNHIRLWALSIPGLREDSPLVEMGDTIQIRQLYVNGAGDVIQLPVFLAGMIAYRAWTGRQHNAVVYGISRVHQTVYLRVDDLEHLAPYNSQDVLPMVVNVVFQAKDRIVQAQRSALLSVSRNFEESSTASGNDWIRRMLFPLGSDGRLQTRLRNIPHREFFDHAINYEQAQAVNSVCTNDFGTLPYLVSGPPGTGKTKTLVEMAMQLLNTTKLAHVLICAPSEAAADTLALRLMRYLSPEQLLRLNAPSRADNEVPRELLQYCFVQDDMFYLPPIKKLMQCSVVVISCRDTAILAEARLTNADLWTMEREFNSILHPEEEPLTPSLHWGALLLDEAGQAAEFDVLSAIRVLCPPSAYSQDHRQPILVMTGDEHQLGPRTASRDPVVCRSLFARLFSRALYADHPLSRSKARPSSLPPVLKRSMLPILHPPFTNLIRNYRSHPAILSVPSSLFYHDTLITEVVFHNTPLQASSLWRGRKWPVLYIPHNGPDEIERDNGGWYNMSEARLACSIAETLVLRDGVKQADVCIMSPFAAQVKILRSMIRSSRYGGGKGLWDVNIGPVEAFQGLEKRAVVICTTRTRQRFVDEDVKRAMGLVHQKRKMNVALTRAKEALFVIGCPKILAADDAWRTWMTFCERNGLVDDQYSVWRDRGMCCDIKAGVLERALVARAEEMQREQWPALGAAAADYDIDGGKYSAWTESLRKALDEEESEVVAEDRDDDDSDAEHDHGDEDDAQSESLVKVEQYLFARAP